MIIYVLIFKTTLVDCYRMYPDGRRLSGYIRFKNTVLRSDQLWRALMVLSRHMLGVVWRMKPTVAITSWARVDSTPAMCLMASFRVFLL